MKNFWLQSKKDQTVEMMNNYVFARYPEAGGFSEAARVKSDLASEFDEFDNHSIRLVLFTNSTHPGSHWVVMPQEDLDKPLIGYKELERRGVERR